MNDNRTKLSSKHVMQIFTLLAAATVLNTGFAVAAPKADKQPVAITLTLKKIVVDAKGKETQQDAPKINPGDLLEYRAVYRNRSKQPISGLNASLPVPVGFEYVANTAKPLGALASVDNVKYEPVPLKRMVKDKAGASQQVDVPLIEYRSLRWAVNTLEAGKKTEVSARMRVIDIPKSPEELVKKPASKASVMVQPSIIPTQ